MTHTIILTPEYVKRVKSALLETKNLLAKEMAYSLELRNQSQITFYHSHIAKLEGYLSAGMVQQEI